MYQNQNFNQPQMNRTPIYLKGRPVSSIEEVKASPIDFDGSIFYFPDLANKKIYTKYINLDGTASVNMYELKEIAPTGYVTKEEFENVINQLKAAFISNSNSEGGKENYEF